MDAKAMNAHANNASAISENEIRLLLDAIYLQFHHDFRGYSMASLRRRISAALIAMNCATVSALQEKLFQSY